MGKEKGKKGRNRGRIKDRCPSHKRAIAGHWTELHKFVKIARSQGLTAAKAYIDRLFEKGIYVPQNLVRSETLRLEARKERKDASGKRKAKAARTA